MFDLIYKPFYKKCFCPLTVSWDEALNHIDILEKDGGIHDKSIRILKSHGFISHKGERLKSVKNLLNQLKDKISSTDYPIATAHLYGGITSTSLTTQKHHDYCHVWYWQCKGITKWILNETEEYILEEGDILYVPPEVTHEVIPLSPRLGISFGAEKE